MKKSARITLIIGSGVALVAVSLMLCRERSASPPDITLSELDARAAPYFAVAHQRVSEAVKTICEHPIRLCAKMAKDSIAGTRDTAVFLDPALNLVTEECRKGAAVYGVNADTSDFRQNVEAVNKANGIDQGTALGEAILETAFIVPTITTVGKILAPASAKMVSDCTSGVACAAADGPLPVMDIIGVALAAGGTAWSVYDIWQCRKELPETLTDTLHRMIDDTRDACRKEVAP